MRKTKIRTNRQIGTSVYKLDKLRKAKTPGKRKAKKSGKTYYEYRKNRSDKKGKRI